MPGLGRIGHSPRTDLQSSLEKQEFAMFSPALVKRLALPLAVSFALACVPLAGCVQAAGARAAPAKGFARVKPNPEAGEGERIALVIGNKAYRDVPLANPVNDARSMKSALERVGFRVFYRENADLPQMDEAVHEFIRALRQDSVGLFYFAGHGAQADGANYLIPVKAGIANKSELKARAYDAGIVLGQMQEAGNGVNIVILDACRNNPFKGFRAASDGLANMSGPEGSLIAFATAPGDVAADGAGENGTYTKYLKEYIARPGLSIEQMFKQVRQAVRAESRGDQIPWENSSLLGEFCFAGCAGAPTVATLVPPPPVEPPAPDPSAEERELWNSVKDSQDPEDVRAYLQRFPQGLHADLARNRLKRLQTPPPVAQIAAAAAHGPAPVEPPKPPAASPCAHCPEMVKLPAGEFMMGSNDGSSDEKPAHRVSVKAFAIGKREVTQGQWRAVMGGNPSRFSSCGDDCPVESVGWNDAQDYIERLNRQTGGRYRLPTEAEWEYACRAGGTQEYCGSGDPDAAAWHSGNSGGKTHPAGGKRANAWGLHDMSGNVWEWTCSAYTAGGYDGSEKTCTNDASARRATRGGSWNHGPRDVRSANRNWVDPARRDDTLGFRLAQD
jgi:formylglycine-generating enzyme required for sulfatase activity